MGDIVFKLSVMGCDPVPKVWKEAGQAPVGEPYSKPDDPEIELDQIISKISCLR
jgi:hypothetical protein